MKPKLFSSLPGGQLSIWLALLVILLLPTPSSGEALLPTVVPPPGVSQIVFGTTLSGQPDCTMTDPLSEPIIYAPGATQIAFQIVPVVPGDYSFRASIEPAFGVRTVSRGCNKVSLCSGRICYHSYGYTINRVDDLPFTPGDYVFELSFEGSTPVSIPFKILGNASSRLVYLPIALKE